MKFDMHCHTQEGSLDGKIPVAEYIRLLKAKGFGGDACHRPRFL